MTDTTEQASSAPTTQLDDGVADDPGSGAERFGELVAGLRATFDSGRTRPLEWRRAQLDGLLTMLVDHEDELVGAIADDLRRHEFEGYAADIGHAKGEVRLMAKNLASWAKPRRVRLPLTAQPGKGWIVPEPLGVVLVIAPWNYPIQLLVEPVAAALAAGNTVVAKPSELAPACSAALARLLPRYLDDSAVAVVEGGVPETTALLEQRYDHIFFTGSTNVGRVVMRAAAEHLTPVTLELGGKSPAIVAADADLDVAARRIAWGKHLNAGQTCIAPDYVLVEATVRDELVDKLADTFDDFHPDGPQASGDFARIINDRHLDRLRGLLDDHGGTVAHGGEVIHGDRYVAPTLVVDPDSTSALMTEEIFGPILPVITVESVDHAIEFVNEREKPLALYLFSGSDATADHVVEATSSGGVCVNHTLMHNVPHTLPFGGVGHSGMGTCHGKAGFDTFTHHKSVLRKPTRPDPSILYPPYSKLKTKLVKKVM
jgi:aldehyde dehydrogenase (NAD+)